MLRKEDAHIVAALQHRTGFQIKWQRSPFPTVWVSTLDPLNLMIGIGPNIFPLPNLIQFLLRFTH